MRRVAINLCISSAGRANTPLDMFDEPERESLLPFPGVFTYGASFCADIRFGTLHFRYCLVHLSTSPEYFRFQLLVRITVCNLFALILFPQLIYFFQVTLPCFQVRPVDGIEIFMLHFLNPRITERKVIVQLFDGLFYALSCFNRGIRPPRLPFQPSMLNP
jgi:hypothetical protein